MNKFLLTNPYSKFDDIRDTNPFNLDKKQSLNIRIARHV